MLNISLVVFEPKNIVLVIFYKQNVIPDYIHVYKNDISKLNNNINNLL